MGEQVVTHTGWVKKVDDQGKVEISVIVKSSCASCEISGSCSLSDMKEKIIEVSKSESEEFKAGQPVTIIMKQSLGTWAVLLGYVFPLIVLVGGLFIFVGTGMDQGLSAILAIALLVPYYLTLYLVRDYIRKRFTYTVRPE
ncbi:MAG: SoxR reducing system RseC family protein [Chlorobi bacterium]|nr:SoxR reducing system RseC family protein [Chlorobiota bacterium]